MLDLCGLDELRGIEIRRDELVLGALVTWAELRRSPLVHAALPVLAEVAAVVGAVAIQNRGTIGGNCVTASPAGDLLPVLLATDALLEVVGPGGRRRSRRPSSGPATGETALAPGELLAAVRIPLVPDRQVRFRKVGTRRALAIAKVLVAVAWRPGAATGRAGAPGTTSASPSARSRRGRSGPRARRRSSRAASRTPRGRGCRRPSWTRSPPSTTSARRPRTGAPSPAASSGASSCDEAP